MADQEPARDGDPAETPPIPPVAPTVEPHGGKAKSQVDDDSAERAATRTDTYLTRIKHLRSDVMIIGGEPIRPPRRSVDVGPDEIAKTARFFHAPPVFEDALSRLGNDNMAVLCGAEGSGRWCAALRLLESLQSPVTVLDRPIERFAPVTQLANLHDHAFRRGGRYLLADLVYDDDQAQLRFDTAALWERVRQQGAFFVMTSDASASMFGDPAVAWTPTDILAVFDAYVSTAGWPSDQVADMRDLVAQLPLHRFAEAIDLVEHDGIESARARFGSRVAEELRSWLGGEAQPTVPDLVPLVTAALIPDAIEHEHERRSDELCKAIDAHAERTRSEAGYTDAIRPARSDRKKFVRRKPAPQSSKMLVSLTANLPAEVVLSELHERYGDQLWVPVRAWLDGQPDADLDVAESLAVGLSALRQIDGGLTGRILQAWAGGNDDQRWAAAVANFVLCRDDRGVRIALAQASRWVHGSQAQRITAIYAFSLGLVLADPRQAISLLWNLTLSDAVVARYARTHLAALARDTANSGIRRRLLAIVDHQLTYLVEARHDDDPLIGRALTNIAEILAVQAVDGTPLTVQVVEADPGQTPLLGRLWAQLLRSWPHRATALDGLHASYTRLADGPRAALGTAIRRRMSPMEWRWMCRDLGIELPTETDLLETVQ